MSFLGYGGRYNGCNPEVVGKEAEAVIEELTRALRDREVLMWAMVRAAGGSILVRNYDLALGYPEAWVIEEDVAQNGRRFTIERKVR